MLRLCVNNLYLQTEFTFCKLWQNRTINYASARLSYFKTIIWSYVSYLNYHFETNIPIVTTEKKWYSILMEIHDISLKNNWAFFWHRKWLIFDVRHEYVFSIQNTIIGYIYSNEENAPNFFQYINYYRIEKEIQVSWFCIYSLQNKMLKMFALCTHTKVSLRCIIK